MFPVTSIPSPTSTLPVKVAKGVSAVISVSALRRRLSLLSIVIVVVVAKM